MIRNKYGPDMVAKDKKDLDEVIESAIAEVGPDYGAVLEVVVADIDDGHYSKALKYNVMRRTSWFLNYLRTSVEISN